MIRRTTAALALSLLSAPGGAGAQTAADLAASCVGAGGGPTWCARAAGAGRDLAGYMGVLAGPGAELPGQGSTLGMRLGGMPRVAASVRAAGVQVAVPSLASVGADDGSHSVFGAQVTLAAGVFEGLSVLPTVGGVFSVDVIGSASFLLFPNGDGFDGRTDVLSIGARVGILRESFTLPAVTVSASRRFAGGLQLGDVAGSDSAQVALDPAVNSLRATVSKDLFAFGVMAGVGWDDLTAETTVRATNGVGGFTSSTGSVNASRRTYFLGVSKQIAVLAWASAELGWVSGFAPVTAGSGSSPDTGRTFYGSVALLLKL
jgi:hypothetical protein